MNTTTTFEVEAIVEIPFGSMFKYEIDKHSEKLVLDRALNREIPCNYGFIPNTLHLDGDPLDICILSRYPIYPLTKTRVSIVGAFKCIDNGVSDDKLIGVIAGHPSYLEAQLSDLRGYLSSYKEGFVVNEEVGMEEAWDILLKDRERFLK